MHDFQIKQGGCFKYKAKICFPANALIQGSTSITQGRTKQGGFQRTCQASSLDLRSTQKQAVCT